MASRTGRRRPTGSPSKSSRARGSKRLARTYRFAATVFAINPAGPIDWGDLAGGAGYFDQAHFGHEFRAFTRDPLPAPGGAG